MSLVLFRRLKYLKSYERILLTISNWNKSIHSLCWYFFIDLDEEVDLDAIDDSGYELVLPSGAKIGHRSLMRYYKQSLNPDKQLVLRKPSEKMLAHYRLVFVRDIKMVTCLCTLFFKIFVLHKYLAHRIQ